MISYHSRLNRLMWQERFVLAGKITLVATSGLLLVGLLALLYMPAGMAEVSGTVASYYGESDDAGSRQYLVVRLDAGPTVMARVGGNVAFKPRHRVTLSETTTRFFGYKRYKFMRYIEEPNESEKLFIDSPRG